MWQEEKPFITTTIIIIVNINIYYYYIKKVYMIQQHAQMEKNLSLH